MNAACIACVTDVKHSPTSTRKIKVCDMWSPRKSCCRWGTSNPSMSKIDVSNKGIYLLYLIIKGVPPADQSALDSGLEVFQTTLEPLGTNKWWVESRFHFFYQFPKCDATRKNYTQEHLKEIELLGCTWQGHPREVFKNKKKAFEKTAWLLS